MEHWLFPLYDAEGMRAVDRWAIEEQGIPSLELMEDAGAAVAAATAELAGDGPVRVVCGKGNNGGDGLVAARRLAETGFEVDVLLLSAPDELSEDAQANFRRLGDVPASTPEDFDRALAGSTAVIDALLGTGFEGSPREPVAGAIEALNRCGAPVVACDIASGVNAANG